MYITFSKANICITPWIRLATVQTVRSTCKIAVDVESSLLSKLETSEINPKRHPGISRAKNVELPNNTSKALHRAIGDYPVKALINDCKRLDQYIMSRHPPPERSEIEEKTKEIVDEIDQKIGTEKLQQVATEAESDRQKKSRARVIQKTISQRTYAWKPMTYSAYEALVYAIGRGAREYGILTNILNELNKRDPDFKPRSYFDFGSGVGTGMWAASALWKHSIFEYYNVDSCREMNELSELIICEGNENQQSTLKNVFYRQFLPSSETKYDLIISAFSLFELPNAQTRKEVMLRLWHKCDGYLVLVEEGSRRGSELVNEIRDYLLDKNEENLKGSVFAPCPHDNKCPRLTVTDDKTPCNFEISYVPFNLEKHVGERAKARYSYVVLRKGSIEDSTRPWPRLIRPTLVRSKHVVCRLCTSKGNLQEIIFTQSKHGKSAYRCAKASRWGDRLPIEVGEKYDTKSNE